MMAPAKTPKPRVNRKYEGNEVWSVMQASMRGQAKTAPSTPQNDDDEPSDRMRHGISLIASSSLEAPADTASLRVASDTISRSREPRAVAGGGFEAQRPRGQGKVDQRILVNSERPENRFAPSGQNRLVPVDRKSESVDHRGDPERSFQGNEGHLDVHFRLQRIDLEGKLPGIEALGHHSDLVGPGPKPIRFWGTPPRQSTARLGPAG